MSECKNAYLVLQAILVIFKNNIVSYSFEALKALNNCNTHIVLLLINIVFTDTS